MFLFFLFPIGSPGCSTYARYRIRRSIRYTAALAGRRHRPYIPNERLRYTLIGYARISKADGSQSLDLQRDALREAGVSDDAIYEDQASGQREDRPGLAAFLKAARQGDVIVVWRLDRLGRNLRHLVNLVQDLNDRDIGIRVLAGQGASLDTTTASGKLVFALFAALAEFERELIRERTLAGLASARARGRKGGRHEGQRALPRARRNQGDDLPLRSARWFLEKPRATGPGSLGGPKSGP